MSAAEEEDENERRMWMVLPVVAATAGFGLGFLRGSRTASLRFLAENAHRRPTTVQGWYFYNKTKNYRVLLGAMKEGARHAVRLGVVGGMWVGFENGIRGTGLVTSPELAAGGAAVGTSAVFAAVYRLPLRSARKVLGLGFVIGGVVAAGRYASKEIKDRVEATRTLGPSSAEARIEAK